MSLSVPAWLFPAATREKPEPTPLYRGSSLVLIDQPHSLSPLIRSPSTLFKKAALTATVSQKRKEFCFHISISALTLPLLHMNPVGLTLSLTTAVNALSGINTSTVSQTHTS